MRASSPRFCRPIIGAAVSSAAYAAGLAVGALNGFTVTVMRIQPFIATLATMLAAYGTACCLRKQSVSVSYDSGLHGDSQRLPWLFRFAAGSPLSSMLPAAVLDTPARRPPCAGDRDGRSDAALRA